MNINQYIDHTNLKADMKYDDLIKLCDEAKKYNFKSVCINPCWVKKAKEYLQDTPVLVCCVIGFPLGANTTETKVYEAQDAINNGADEIDMVINIGRLKDKDYEYVYNEIKQIKEVMGNHILKVIIETCMLDEEEKVAACKIVMEAGADFVKTSTGMAQNGATVEDVTLMKSIVSPELEVKAAGGVRNIEDALAMIEAGATRIGTSGGVKIVQGLEHNNGY